MIEQPGRKKRGLMQEDAGGRQRFRRQSPSSVASDRREQETRVFPMIMFFEIEAARPLRVEDGRAVYVSCKKARYLSEARFLCPSGTRNARFFVLRHRAWGTEGKRQPGGLLPPKAAKRPEGVSKYKGCARTARRTPIFARERNERWARTAPSATIERPGVCPKPRQGAKGSVCPVGTWAKGPKRPAAHRREASARWAVARSAKRPAGVSKYKGCARPARRTPIFARAAKP